MFNATNMAKVTVIRAVYKWNCSFCDANYNSEGGFYGHLRMKHGVGRNGQKLLMDLIEKMSKEYKEEA